MYLAYIAIGVGIFLIEGHLALQFYPVALFLLAELLVKLEDPGLLERFGTEYEAYCQQVPRCPRP
jgi:protein-S-isoprenylcysteine O-methyltransferase Ste14